MVWVVAIVVGSSARIQKMTEFSGGGVCSWGDVGGLVCMTCVRLLRPLDVV